MDRDLIGYGAIPPNPNCPGAVRLAANLVPNFEAGPEPSIGGGGPARIVHQNKVRAQRLRQRTDRRHSW